MTIMAQCHQGSPILSHADQYQIEGDLKILMIFVEQFIFNVKKGKRGKENRCYN